MSKKTYIICCLIALLSLPCLFSAVKQVRVIIDRASIYVEPSRASARIETVEKGTVLTLFQQKKVKEAWYYVSFTSPRYGSRISGFIHESAVEPIEEAEKFVEKKEELKPEPSPPAPPEKPSAPPQKIEAAKIEEKREPKVEPKPVLPVEETLVLTSLPKSKALKLPRKLPEYKDLAWRVAVSPFKTEEKPEIKKEETKETVEIAEKAAAEPKHVEPPPLIKKEEPKEKPAAKETAEEKKPPVVTPPKPPLEQPIPTKPPQRGAFPRARGFLTFGAGYGPSAGGAGGFLQVNTKAGFALHAGIGVYPTTIIYSETDWVKNEVLWSVGIKYYLPFRFSSLYPYIDIQYGGLRVEAAQIIIGIWDYSYVYSQEQKTLSGPSVLAGTEFRRGRFGLNGAIGISYNLTEWELLTQKLFFAFDLGLVVYF